MLSSTAVAVFLLALLFPANAQYYGRYGLTGNPYIGYSPYAGASSFYGKPSYSWLSPYTGAYGMAGYEGPPYGVNTYWQPGVAYPPYGAAMGYGAAPYGGGALMCQDRSTSCPMLASSGQCATSASTRALCPQSCGTGCPDLGMGLGSPLAGAYPPSPLGTAGPPLPLGAAAYPPSASSGQYGGAPGAYGPDSGAPFYCRDSHIYGCPQWAQSGLCQSVPEYMMNYCRASCGVCGAAGGQYGGGGAGPRPGLLAPFGQQQMGTRPLGAGPLGSGPLGAGPMNGAAAPLGAGPLGAGSSSPFGDFGAGAGGPPSLGFSTDVFGNGNADLLSGGGLPLSSPLASVYSPYYPIRSASAAALTAAGRKEKQQQSGASKVLFSEDEQQQDPLVDAWSAVGLPNSVGTSAAQIPSIFDQQPASTSSTSSAFFNLPASSLNTQHSSLSKMVRMDDLLEKTKKSKS